MKLLRQILGPFLALLLTFGSVVEVSAPVTVAAGVVLGVGHAQAATPAQKAVVLNGVPGWVLRVNGVLPSIDMDFAHNRAWVGGSGVRAPPSLITDVRASTAYASWADGHLSLFAANIPRITDLGLLVEQAATNLALQSQTFDNASWTKNNTTITAAAATAPDGTLTGQTLTPATGSNNKVLFIGFTATAAAYTDDLYVKSNGGRWIALSFGSDAVNDGAFFDLTNGVVGTVAASTTATITALANGWYRCTITRTLFAATRDVEIEPHSADNQSSTWNSAAGAEKFFIWGADAELGAFATSYIPTTTVAVARAADNITVSLGSWFVPGKGTMLAKVLLPSLPPTVSSGSTFAAFNDGSNSNRLQLYMNNGAAAPNTISTSGGSNQYVGNPGGAPSANTAFKIAMRWANSSYGSAVNGGSEHTQASGSVPGGLTQLVFGASGSGYPNGYVQSFAYFPQARNTTSLTVLP